jgi:hypothetical protein
MNYNKYNYIDPKVIENLNDYIYLALNCPLIDFIVYYPLNKDEEIKSPPKQIYAAFYKNTFLIGKPKIQIFKNLLMHIGEGPISNIYLFLLPKDLADVFQNIRIYKHY